MDTITENTCDNCQHEEVEIDGDPCNSCAPLITGSGIDFQVWSNFITPANYEKEMATARRNQPVHPTEPSPLAAINIQVGGSHYKSLPIQPVQYIHMNNIPFIEGCIIKYATRWRDKGGVSDLKKIIHFTELLIELEANA